MALSNLGFEDDDPAFVGVPEFWTLAVTGTAAEAAGYADGSPAAEGLDPTEDFGGGWSTNQDYVFAYADPQDPGELESAIYDGALPKPESVEDFEEGWSLNQAYSFTMGSVAQASFDGNIFVDGTVAEPYTTLNLLDDQRMTTDLGGIALSDGIAAVRAEHLASGGTYNFPVIEGDQRVQVTVDVLAPVTTDLQGASTSIIARNLLNSDFQAAHSVDSCEDIIGQLRFFGQLLGTNGLIGLDNVDGGTSISGNSQLYDLFDGATLTVEVNGAGVQTITFNTEDFANILLATAQEVVDVINAQIAGAAEAFLSGAGPSFFVGIRTTALGLSNPSDIRVTGGTGNTGGVQRLQFGTTIRESPVQRMGLVPSNVAGTGNVGDLTSILAAELAAIINGSAAIQAIGGAAVAANVPGLGITLRILTNTTDGTGTIEPEASAVGTAVGFTAGVPVGPTGGVGELLEDFEDLWSSNESYSFTMGATTAASYDSGTPQDVEDFEEEWKSNGTYSFTMGGTTAAVYDTGPGGATEAVEDFEEVKEPFAVTADPVTDEVLKTTHGLSNGQVVQFSNTNGTLPAGLGPDTDYFVVSAAASTFKVSATSGGAAIDITDAGTGTHIVKPDPSVFWTLAMVTL